MERALEAVLRRDRWIILGALAVITALAWAYLIWFPTEGEHHSIVMSGMDLADDYAPTASGSSATAFAVSSAMWVVMMVGMMTPSAAPIILLYARVGRSAEAQGKPFAPAAWFAGGYLLVWTAFGLVAALLQLQLQAMALLSPGMASSTDVFAAGLLIAAGIYQWTPLKRSCLRYCQSPLQFIQRHGGFRADAPGALALGTRHGAYCVGCCWALMLLLFAGGMMNLLWVAAIAGLVLLEKLLPFGPSIARTAGALMVASGLVLAFPGSP
jgi:predicted metal-binding membrane protein